ncbi:MAG TPA: ArsC/Spx/MgsR family protein [Candidatus Acidoferrum sp.]|jgi:arsenate reductase|nr:ArsC/Spx/MgsR family protein [Candidatus Acidoferrum sp.]
MSSAKTPRKASSATKRTKRAQFLHKPNCTTCRKAKKFMEKRGFQLYFRDLAKDKLSVAELEDLIGNHDYRDFLNSRNELFRKAKMKDEPPSRKQAVRLMSKEPNLIRRPVILAGGHVVLGFDEKGMAKL